MSANFQTYKNKQTGEEVLGRFERNVSSSSYWGFRWCLRHIKHGEDGRRKYFLFKTKEDFKHFFKKVKNDKAK